MASNAPVYTRRSLLVADRPQAPVNPGAGAPGFLSRLWHLLCPAGQRKFSSPLHLPLMFLLLRVHAQEALRVVFRCEQFHHFCPCLFQLRIDFPALRIQSGILLLQGLDAWQLLQTEGIKIPLRRLTGNDVAGMIVIKFCLLLPGQLAILGVDLAGLAVRPDVPLKFGDFFFFVR